MGKSARVESLAVGVPNVLWVWCFFFFLWRHTVYYYLGFSEKNGECNISYWEKKHLLSYIKRELESLMHGIGDREGYVLPTRRRRTRGFLDR